MSLWQTSLLLCAVVRLPVEAFDFVFEKHICAVCNEVQQGYPCERFNACAVINASSSREKCASYCPQAAAPTLKVAAAEPDVRVTKAFGTKGYDQIRLSVITSDPDAHVPNLFDYSAQFKYRWTDKYIHTTMKTVKSGETTTFNVGEDISVSLPAQGEGVAGVLIADPCVLGASITSLISCQYGKKFQTYTRTVELINAFVPDKSTNFWGIFGDNFYDRTGKLTTDIFGRISLKAKSKLFLSVAGNHDYWVLGEPSVATTLDQCGNGHMQFYAQDSKAAESNFAGNSTAPFDFTVDPSKGHIVGLGCNQAAMENFFWYNQIGNVGIVGQSGAYPYEQVKPFMQEACTWLSKQSGLDVAILVGHWDVSGMGASSEMAMPLWYTEMATLPGCKEFDSRGMLKFVMGHTHCNDPHPHGKVGTGFRVAGFGMEGCGNYGMPMVDTTENRVRFWYFDTSSDEKYSAVIKCVTTKGWRQCSDLATLWLDQAIQKSTAVVV
jgi:hypothetical protein